MCLVISSSLVVSHNQVTQEHHKAEKEQVLLHKQNPRVSGHNRLCPPGVPRARLWKKSCGRHARLRGSGQEWEAGTQGQKGTRTQRGRDRD